MALTSELCEYRSEWPSEFENECSQIQIKLGDHVWEVHHIGSTAIPGIKAKPEIDLLIIVKDIGEIDVINAAMNELGYDVRGECGIEGRHYYSKNFQSTRTHKAHVCVRSNNSVWKMLAFRDYLRDHPEEAQEYSKLKERLAKDNTRGMAEYLDGKKDFIETVLKAALEKNYCREFI